jgi:hypothetical protein
MSLSPDLTLKEVAERLAKSGSQLHLHLEHGVYHAYVLRDHQITAYDRGDLAEAIDGATRQAG